MTLGSQLSDLQNTIAEMGGLVESQLTRAIEALVRCDQDEAARVAADDAAIDALERAISDRVIVLLGQERPNEADLRAVLAALRIAGDLERMGDYAKNIAKRVVAVAPVQPAGPIHSIARMSRLVHEIIGSVLDAYTQGDTALAEDARQRDQEVDNLHTSLFRELLTYMVEDHRNISSCAHLLFIAKNIERIGDHATNIAESVLFLVDGTAPPAARPKKDRSDAVSVPTTGD